MEMYYSFGKVVSLLSFFVVKYSAFIDCVFCIYVLNVCGIDFIEYKELFSNVS